MLIHLVSEMKHEVHGTWQPRHISKIDKGGSIPQQSDLLVQTINQRFAKVICGIYYLFRSGKNRRFGSNRGVCKKDCVD